MRTTLLIIFLALAGKLFAQWDFKTDYFGIHINNKGFITSMKNSTVRPYREFSPADRPSPLMLLFDGGSKTCYEPVKASYSAAVRLLRLTYSNGSVACIRISPQKNTLNCNYYRSQKGQGSKPSNGAPATLPLPTCWERSLA